MIERAALLSEDERIDIDDLPAELVEATPSQPRPVGWSAGPIDTAGEARGSVKPLDHILREAVEQSLRQARGDCAKAARILGISRPAIYRKMVRLGISNAAVRRYRGFPQPALTRSARDRPAHEAPAAGPSAHATTPNYPASHK